MLISDWSADVCSSDLPDRSLRLVDDDRRLTDGVRTPRLPRTVLVERSGAKRTLVADPADRLGLQQEGLAGGEAIAFAAHHADRKSGVAGKGGSGRLDSGGRLDYKKKEKEIIQT